MVTYEGLRRTYGNNIIIRASVDKDGKAKVELLDPAPSQALYNHSPDGFEWGYSGSGPAQLALALLLDATGDKGISLRYHQEFKEKFVALFGDSWQITAEQVQRWVKLKQNFEQIEIQEES